MSKSTQEALNIDQFLEDVVEKVKEGMSYEDAIQLSAVLIGGAVTPLVLQAINKYQEATYSMTELSQQENVDECALASMDSLWHGEHYNGSQEEVESSVEDAFLDSIYFILKYAKTENPLEEALQANDKICGDKTARAIAISKVFEC